VIAPTLDALKAALFPKPTGSSVLHVYAMLDAARNERIYPFVLGCGLPYVCMYTGVLPLALRQTAPYLVALKADAPFTDALLQEGWGDNWGVFFSSTGTLEDLRRHYKKLLKVEDATGKVLIFRFYDPRVLRVYLPTCNAGELRTMFGPSSFLSMEAEDRSTLLRYHREDDALQESKTTLKG